MSAPKLLDLVVSGARQHPSIRTEKACVSWKPLGWGLKTSTLPGIKCSARNGNIDRYTIFLFVRKVAAQEVA